MANYPQELAQDAVCQSHTGHMTGLWFPPTRPLRLNTNEWMNETLKCLCWLFIYYGPFRNVYVAYCPTYVLLLSVACSVHFMYLHLIVLTALDDRTMWHFSLCITLCSLVVTFLLDSQTISVHFVLRNEIQPCDKVDQG